MAFGQLGAVVSERFYEEFTEEKLQWVGGGVRFLEMKLFWLSSFALCFGAVLGWDWSGMDVEEGVGAVALSDREPEKVAVEEVVDPEWLVWADRIKGAGNGEELKGLSAELDASGFAKRAGLVKLICRRWVELDPEGGIEAVRLQVDGWKVMPVYFAEWMAKDPEKAIAGIAALDGHLAGRMGNLVLGALLEGDDVDATLIYLQRTGKIETAWGGKAGEGLMRLLRERTDEMEAVIVRLIEKEGKGMSHPTGHLVNKLGQVKFESGSDLAVKWAAGFEGEYGRYALEGVMEAWVELDLKAAVARMEEWAAAGNQTREMIFARKSLDYKVARLLTGEDFSAALGWLDRRGTWSCAGVVAEVIRAKMRAGEVSPNAVYDEIAKMEDPHLIVRKSVFKELWGGIGAEELGEIVGVIQGKEASQTKSMAMASLLKEAMVKSPFETAKVISNLPAGEARDEVVGKILRGHDKTLGAVDFIQALSLEDRGTAVLAFYENAPVIDRVWGYHLEVYPGVLAEGLMAVPDAASRVEAMKRVGFHWGAIDPIGAVKWVDGISGEEQVAAMAKVTEGWSKQDPRSVTDFVEGLSKGGARDGAISGLVAGVGEHDPESAWLWSGMIDGEEMRKEARAAAVGWWVEMDKEAAREALDQVDLPRTEAEALRAILER